MTIWDDEQKAAYFTGRDAVNKDASPQAQERYREEVLKERFGPRATNEYADRYIIGQNGRKIHFYDPMY